MYQLRRMGRIDADLLWEKTKDLEIILLHVLHFEDLGGIEGGSPLQRHRRSAHQWLRHRPDGFEVSNGQMVSTDQGMLRPVACFIGFVSQLAGQLHDMVCFDRQSAREEKHEGLEEVCRLV